MSRVFNRAGMKDDSLADGIDELRRSNSPEERSLGLNLAFDHRITAERESRFRRSFTNVSDSKRLKEAVRKYHLHYVCRTATPDFVDSHLNAENIVPDDGFRHDETKLCRVLNLSRLVKVYAWDSKRNRSNRDLNYPKSCGGMASTHQASNSSAAESFWRAWVDNELRTTSIAKRRRLFVGKVLRVVGEYGRKVEPYEPWWAAEWEQFHHLVGDPQNATSADRWAQALGVAAAPGSWLAVVRYSFRDIGRRLFRPTQLDAGWNHWHFPSPPECPITLGGHPMDMAEPTNYFGLVSEYIHSAPQHLDESHVVAVARTHSAVDAKNLPSLRTRHRDRLSKEYPRLPTDWLPNEY